MVLDIIKNKKITHDNAAFITSTILGSVAENVIKKIILFGSYANGKPNRNSDIDLCIIIANKRNSRAVYLKIALALFNRKIIPVDLLVYREKDFNIGIRKNERGIESVISSEGKVLYAQE